MDGWIEEFLVVFFSLIKLSFISEFDDTPKGGSFSF